MKQLALFILLLLGNQCYSQSNEIAEPNIFGYRISDVVEGTYNIIRTDEDGKVVWIKPMISNNTIPFDLLDNQYIIYGFTQIKNNKITNISSDYDYWLVRSDLDYEIAVYPNPVSSILYVSLSNYNEKTYINIYDITHKLVFNNQITQYQNYFNLLHLSNGTYIYEIVDSNKLIKTGKLCVLQNY